MKCGVACSGCYVDVDAEVAVYVDVCIGVVECIGLFYLLDELVEFSQCKGRK